jgi:DNA polymerase III alpha subunit
MYGVLPLFKSHYSIGRSILTLEQENESPPENYPESIIDLALKNDISKLFLVEDNMSGFLQAYTSSKEAGLTLVFGLRIDICSDMEQKDAESLSKTCKYMLLAKNTNGYKRLIKIFSVAAQEGFYYRPRIDFKTLKNFWDEKDLQMVVPFYDSFIFNNVMGYANCVPDFNFAEPVFLLEDSSLPFDGLIKDKVNSYCQDKYKTVRARSIFYKSREDFKSYLTFRCINNRSTLNKPNFDHMGSDQFCLESWREQNSNATTSEA